MTLARLFLFFFLSVKVDQIKVACWEVFHRLHRFDVSVKKKKRERDRVSAGFTRVARVSGQPAGSTGFSRANFQAGFYLDPDRS